MLKTTEPSQRTTTAYFLFSASLPMYVALFIAKARAYRGGAVHAWQSWMSIRFYLDVLIVAYHDLLFILGLAALGAVLLFLTRSHSRLRSGAELLCLFASAFCVAYGFINAGVYRAVGMPLTYPLLRIAGNSTTIRSSVTSFATPSWLAMVAVAPLVYLAMVWSMLRASHWLQRWKTYAIVAVAIAIYLPAGAHGYALRFHGGIEEGAAQSPHWAMLCSLVEHWSHNGEDHLHETGPEAYRDDFRPAGTRPVSYRALRPSPIKNVIVVVLESTGTQFLSVYGSHYRTTPNLEAEAKYSAIYPNFYSNDGYTLYSMMPLLLSCYPGVGWITYIADASHIEGTTAAEALHKRGYRTAFLTTQRLDYRNVLHFFDQRGFDEVYGAEAFQKRGVGTMLSAWGMDDPPMFDHLLQWIDSDPGKPFYAMLWTQQTHYPYALAPGQQRIDFHVNSGAPSGQDLNLYLNGLHLADEQLGRLFSVLRERHLDQNTLVAITGDHGEGFGFPHLWRFHGTEIYQEGVNVPLILWSPALFNGSRSNAVGAHIDLNPTIFDLMGLPLPASWQGHSLMEPGRPQRAYFSCNTGHLRMGLREDDYKFIYNQSEDNEELYNLATDPSEQHNIAAQRPQLCEIYRERLAAWTNFQTDRLHTLVAAVPH